MSNEALAVGIELGTENSRVAVYHKGKAVFIPNNYGEEKTPSFVEFSDQETFVGQRAKTKLFLSNRKNTSTVSKQNVIFDVNKLMGTKYDDPEVQNEIRKWPFQVINNNGNPELKIRFRNQDVYYSPEQISAIILAKLKEFASEWLATAITKAVVTVPAYFNDSQRQATKDAGKLAGLDVLMLLDEPTAAAIAYALDKNVERHKHALIFDLRKRTFDISIIRFEKGLITVTATNRKSLGGDDFSNRLLNHFDQEIKEVRNVDIKQNAVRRILAACERVKRELSSQILAYIEISEVSSGVDFETTITRARFEDLCDDLFEKILDMVRDCVRKAGLLSDEIDNIVLVGGSTRMPKIQQILQEFFSGKTLILNSIDPTEVVALGAAIQAENLNLVEGNQKATKTSKFAIGIDLGTTNTCAAVWRNRIAEVIPNKLGHFVTPSWVSYTDNEVIIGKTAKDNVHRNLLGTFFGIKRIIGRNYDDPVVQQVINDWKFMMEEDESGRPKLVVNYKKKPKYIYPEEVGALILTEIKEAAEEFLGDGTITDAVITVPAYFNDHQRQATKDAARIAGLNVLRLINEPTAAAISYAYDNPEKRERNVLVYDLGGGTFDVSIISLKDWDVKVKATRGDTNLGGGNFDQNCIAYFTDLARKKFGSSFECLSRPAFLARLRNHSERAKHKLSSSVTATIEFPSFDGENDLDEDLTRACFDDLNNDLYQKTLKIMAQCVEEAGLKKEDIDDVVLVGGSTRMIKIEELLKKMFGDVVSKSINPDQAVARGAAIVAAGLKGTLPNPLNIQDVLPMSLGIETLHGKMDILIIRNSQIPTQARRNYTTGVKDQKDIKITILEGDSPNAKENSVLGSFNLLNLPINPSVGVTFQIDISGILTVEATETSSGIHKLVNVTLQKGRLRENEILQYAEKLAYLVEKSKKWTEITNKRNSFERYLFELISETKGNSTIRAKDKDSVLKRIDELFSWLKTEEASYVNRINAQYDDLKNFYEMKLNQ